MTGQPVGWEFVRHSVCVAACAMLPALPQAAGAQSLADATPGKLDALELSGRAAGRSVTLVARVGRHGRVTHFLLENPARLVVDVQGVRHNLARFDFPELSEGPLTGVRTSQFRETTTRLVLDLSEPVAYRVRQLAGEIRVALEWENGDDPTRSEPMPDLVTPAPVAKESATDRRAPADRRVPTDHETSADRGTSADWTAEPELLNPVPETPEGPITVSVTGIAGSTFYVDAGTLHGVFDGDTLRLSRIRSGVKEELGAALVVSAASTEALLAFTGPPFSLTLGDSLAFAVSGATRGRRRTAARDPSGRALPPPSPERAAGGRSVGTAASESAGAESDEQILPFPGRGAIRGRVHVSMNAQSSTTRWRSPTDPVSRTFVTPTTRLRLEASDLPGGVVLNANLRGSYRQEATSLVDPAGSLRVYELSLSRSSDRLPVQLRVGRFFSPHEAFTGYLDGGLLRVGSDGIGVGVAVGLEPDRWNEGFSTERPKRAAFLDFSRAGRSGGISGEVAAVQVLPESAGPEQLYFGWSGRMWMGELSLAHTVQVDRDPTTDGWVISDLLAETTVPLGGSLQIHGTLSRRSPFYYWQATGPVSYRRDDVGAGVSVDLTGAFVSASTFWHQADADSTWHRSYQGSIRVPRLGGSAFGAHGSASYWSDTLLRTLNAGAGVDRSWGRAFTRLGYRLIDSQSAWFEQRSHQAEALIDLPVQPGVRASALGHVRWGLGLRSYRVQLGIWRSF